MLKPLQLPCKRYFVTSILIAFLLGANKALLLKGFLSYGRALKVQSWLYHLWQTEQRRLCTITFRVLEQCFRDGEISLDEDTLNYFRDLKALEAEGRYDLILEQLYIPQKKLMRMAST